MPAVCYWRGGNCISVAAGGDARKYRGVAGALAASNGEMVTD